MDLAARRRIHELRAALATIDDHRSETLQELVRRVGVRGVDGDFKNIIFATNDPKPELVLRDAVIGF